MAVAALAVSGFYAEAAPAPPAAATNGAAQTESLPRAPLALKGTALLDHPERIVGVMGNSDYVIDQNLYDQAREYFLKQIAATPTLRDKLWQPNFSSRSAYQASVKEQRQHLRKLLGLVELTPQKADVATLEKNGGVQIKEVKIALDTDFGVRALLFLPEGSGRQPAIIAIPGAEQSPEEFAGVGDGMTTALWLRKLLGRGMGVAIPEMVERRSDHSLCLKAGGQDRRRVLWRTGYITGRALLGMEVQQVAALGNYLAEQHEIDGKRVGVWGEGQGGMTALYAAAVDEQLAGATVLDYFQQREGSWKEPLDRVLYGQLNEFGDAEVAALIAPRPLVIVTKSGGSVAFDSVRAEKERAARFYKGLGVENKLSTRDQASGEQEASADEIASMLGAREGSLPDITLRISNQQIQKARNEQFEGLYRYTRRLVDESSSRRLEYWKLASTPPQAREAKASRLRKELSDHVGAIPVGDIPLHPRTLLVGETDKFLAYDVLLDTVPGVNAYGQLLVPRAVAGQVNQQLPAVICQHGLGGAPEFVTGIGVNVQPGNHNDLYYHRFGERLAERGYVVFAPYVTVPSYPQDPQYIHRADLINPLVREAASLGMMRTSLEVAKLHRIVDFLQSLSFVDGQRIGYYGLSYGGYSAVWMPPLEPRLRFTIISGFFNSTQASLTAEDSSNSYWGLPDSDMYPWNLLNRFSQTELIAAMWPRPVAVEWGLTDPTTTPEWHKVGWKELKENFIDPWGVADTVVDAAYVGPHTIHGIEAFYFIDRWLRPEESAGRDYNCDGKGYCNQDVAKGRHGYAPDPDVAFVTQSLDSTKESPIRDKFYVSSVSPQLAGIGLKVSRIGHPGDLVVKFGSQEGGSDMGEVRLSEKEIYETYDLWYDLTLTQPVRLDPKKQYWFEVSSASGQAPQDSYVVYGPKPLGGTDYPETFGLSFRITTRADQ